MLEKGEEGGAVEWFAKGFVLLPLRCGNRRYAERGLDWSIHGSCSTA